MTAWIEMIDDDDASPVLRDALERARRPSGTVDNVMRVHSLRPSTMLGHVMLYRAVLHDDANTLPTWMQECVASWVSILNDCEYSWSNHWANARHLLADDARADQIEMALRADEPADVFDARESKLFAYARKLTLAPDTMCPADVDTLREAGYDDGEILELNQLVCYFNYVNRSINGLGVTTANDVIGYYADSPRNSDP